MCFGRLTVDLQRLVFARAPHGFKTSKLRNSEAPASSREVFPSLAETEPSQIPPASVSAQKQHRELDLSTKQSLEAWRASDPLGRP